MSEEKSFSDIPDIPGEIFKDVTFEKDANKLIGLFSPGFSQTGKKIVKWISYDPERKYVQYEVISGEKEEVGHKYEAEVEPKMPFYAFTENALPIALTF